jgi:hypothetical protein
VVIGASEAAMHFGDSVLAMVPELIDQSVQRRRESACWRELVAEHSLVDCNPVMRPYWRWQHKRWGRRCQANRKLAESCQLARARARFEAPA